MNRVWDYVGFAIWFTGLGYIVMWLLGPSDLLMLPPTLHVIGVATALLLPIRLAVRAVGRRRRAPAGAAQPRETALPLRRRHPPRPLRPVKPRSQFGLRGAPH